MNALFGEQRANALRCRLNGLSPELRESAILEELASEIKALGGRFVLPFTFRNAAGTRTSHKLAKESSTEDEGVPSFMYSPADTSMPLLFSLTRPLSAMRHDLLRMFTGRELCRDDIYKSHSVDKPYMRKL
jgi:hypothetical protein